MEKNESNLANFFSWASDLNLAFITKFHNEVKRLLQNELAHINKRLDQEDDQNSDRFRNFQYRKDLYLNTFEPSLRTVTFLMMFSHLEEWLFHLKSSFAGATKLDPNRGSLARFKPVIRDGLGVDLGQCSEWANLVRTEKVRG
ncbi:hypothetical protein R50076_21700 [Gilvimarinus japonicus]